MKKVFSNFLYRCWQLFAALIILLAVLISIVRILIPYMNDYRGDIEDWLSLKVGQEVHIGEIKSEWKMLGPSITVYDINVEDVVYIGSLNADIKTISSLFYGNLITDNLVISGINLFLQQNAAGDFSLSIANNSDNDESSTVSIAAVQDWLQSQTTVNLAEASIRITLRNGESYPIDIAQMQYVSGRNLSQLSGYSELPGNNRIDFTLEMNGYLTDPATTGQLYIDTNVLDLTKLPLSAFWQGAKIQDGAVAIELWLDWQNSEFQSGLATIDINEFQLNLENIPQGLVSRLNTQVVWQALDDGWQLQTNNAVVQSHGRQWPDPFVQLRQIHDSNNTRHGYYLRSSLVDLGIIADLMLANQNLDESLRRRLLTMDTHGFLDALQIDAMTESGKLTDINLSARFSELYFEPYDTTPGIANLSGQIQLNESSGNLYLDSRYSKLKYPDMFRWPLDLEYLNADLDWQFSEDKFSFILQHLDMDIMGTELKADGIFNIDRATDALVMNLYAELNDGDMSQTKYFLPTGVMKPDLVKYLDESIISGELNNVQVLLSGDAQDYPYTNGNGVFEIHGDVLNSEYAFRPDWPSLRDMAADLSFVGNGMDIQLIGANSSGQEIRSAHAVIEDFSAKPSILKVNASSKGLLENAPDYLFNSPLKDNFTELFDTLKVSGPFDFNLDLIVPLGEDDIQINGNIVLQENLVTIPAANLSAKITSGTIDIVNGFAVSKGLTVEVLGGKSMISLDQQSNNGGVETSLSLKGDLSAEGLYASFQKQIPFGLSGKTQYQGTVLLPVNSDNKFELTVQTRMQGIMADLPKPLYKEADVGWPMEFSYQIDNSNNHVLDFRWLEKLHLKIGRLNDQSEFNGMLMFGKQDAELSDRSGIEITGSADQVDLVNWLDYFENNQSGNGDEPVDFSGFYLNELNITELDYFFLNFPDNKISATFTKNKLDFFVDGKRISGTISVPLPIGAEPIDLSLSKLEITDQFLDTQSDHELVDYREAEAEPLPPINLNCKICIYNKKRLGQTDVKLRPLQSGNKLDIKIAENDFLSLDINGQWQYANDRVITQIAGNVATKNLARLLALLNQDAGIRDTSMKVSGAINWLGDPSMFRMQTLSGQVAVEGGKGSQKQLSDRQARIFSVLSLGSIARRLTLDFSDLFQDGFFYTGMSGTFNINQGVFDTRDFDIRGTSADVSINGKTDFANNKVEQCILVTPDLSGSLPILAGWAIEPVTGFVVFLMSKIFQPAIDVVSSIRYQVEGSFDEPIVKEIGKTRAKATIEEKESDKPDIIIEASEKPFSCDDQFKR